MLLFVVVAIVGPEKPTRRVRISTSDEYEVPVSPQSRFFLFEKETFRFPLSSRCTIDSNTNYYLTRVFYEI